MKKVFFVLFLVIYFTDLMGQITNTNWLLPANRSNTRFTSDRFHIPRPALSLRGFDNTVNDAFKHENSHKVYGVRQLIEFMYSANVDPFLQKVIENHIDIASQTSYPSNISVDAEAAILESKALITLLSFIIEKNKIIGRPLNGKTFFYESNLQNHTLYLSNFLSDLRSRRSFVRSVSNDKAFKRGNSLNRLSRAWDLYLALENAYEDLGENTNLLLNVSDKNYWNQEIINQAFTLENGLNALVEGLPFGVNNDEVQAGNWPLIGYAALGTTTLGFNGFDVTVNNSNTPGLATLPHNFMNAAIQATDFTYYDMSNKRKNYWFYQTGGGQAFWAEGPYYFEVMMPVLFDFLHVHRSNNLKATGYAHSIVDPFVDTKFLNALEWHYQLATSTGKTPPLDDGNLKPILSSRLLSWGSSYGNTDIGKKYAFIRDIQKIKEILTRASNYDTRLVELSYEHVPQHAGTPHEAYYGNTSATETSKHQTVIRKKDANGTQHYILMNGERGEAITHGEGHEQVDQMQLLYYVTPQGQNEFSFLMDTGYDEGSAFNNSSWNKYEYHNVLTYNNTNGNDTYRSGDGSYLGPYLDVSEKRKISEHPNIDYLYYEMNNSQKILSLNGQFPIDHFSSNILNQNLYTSKYKRNVLLIKEDLNSNTPTYLIDSNADEFTPHLNFQELDRNKMSITYFSEMLNQTRGRYLRFPSVRHFESSEYSAPYWFYLDIVEEEPHIDNYTQGSFNLRERPITSYFGDKYTLSKKTSITDSWTSLAILNHHPINEVNIPTPQIYYPTDYKERPYQVWAYPHSSSTVDLIIRRANISAFSGNNYPVTISLSNYQHFQFELLSGKDLGFIRLKKVGNHWEHVDDYTYNVEPKTTVLTGELFLTSNQTLDGNIIIDGEEGFVTVHGATLTIAPGSRVVFVGDRVALTTSNGGKIIADGVSFINQNSSDNGVSIHDSGSQFTNCSFEGFSTGLGINSNGVLIDQCLFKNNTRAISVSSGRVAAIYNSTFENNTYGVYALGTVLLDGMGSTYTTGNVFKQNTYGIYAFSNGNIFTENGLYESNTTAAIAKFSGVFGVGKYELGNSFRLNTNLMTNESSFTIDASRQYHNGTAPSNLVNLLYQPTISVDPTNPLNTDYLCGLDVPPRQADEAICPDDDGGGGTNPDPPIDIAKSRNGSDGTAYQVSLQQLNQLLSALYEKPEQLDLEEAMLATFMQFVKHYDQDLQKQSEQFAGFLQYVANQKEPEYLLKKWNLSITNEQQLLASQLYLKLLLLDDQVDQVLRIIDKEARKAQSTIHSLSYLGIKLDIYLRLEDFDQALLIVDQMEALTGKAESRHFASKQASGTNSESASEASSASVEDWTFIRDHITALRGVSKGQTATKSRVTKEAQEPLITNFVLHPSYPNPFNPVTTISFELPEAAMVTVEVFNMTGQLVETLTNQRYSKGQHSLLFDASNRSTGVYLVRAVMGSQVSTQKITLMK